MNIQTFLFPDHGGVIPNIPNPESPNGEFHAGQSVEVDMDTMTVVNVGLINAPVVENTTSPSTADSEATTSQQKGAKE